MQSIFHFAFPIKDLEKTKTFYVDILECKIGRSTSNWIDLDFFGHQLTAQLKPEAVKPLPFLQNDKQPYPVRHFGVILSWEDWHKLLEKLSNKKVKFFIQPHVAFNGEIGEQKTMFVKDPNGYSIEFKTFENPSNIFKAK